MKAARLFSVRAKLPEELLPLLEIAMNLGWISYERAEDLFRRVEPAAQDFGNLDPFSVLTGAPRERLEELAADPGFVARSSALLDDLRNSIHVPRWFQHRPDSPLGSVAYFSPEFGIAQALPQYSGGLGVLAGDHLKAAADLGIPLTGIGLLYHHGYFSQSLDATGWQQEYFPLHDPQNMALRPVDDIEFDVQVDHHTARVRAWEAQVGRLRLYLLDTAVDGNDDDIRLITDRLYGGGPEQRIRQEIVLGVGGVRFLEAMGIAPDVFHMNEGHAAFLALERIRRAMVGDGLTFGEAIEAVRSAHVFTTHTPVPAGIDRFPRRLVGDNFDWWLEETGVELDELMALGHEPGTPPGEQLNLAVLALRLSATANGVSQLHGQVSREMFAGLWPDLPARDRPIGRVTNGVHAHTWVSREMNDLLDRHIGHDWHEASPERWEALSKVPDEQLQAVRGTTRERLIRYVRQRVRRQLLAAGASHGETEWTERLLDPDVLTIGFARRFATYKRADLILSDMEAFDALVFDQERPVQFVIAGKAHPADSPGKEILRRVAQVAADPRYREHFVFVENYDIEVARILLQGVDVWLNTPRRPHEACGTSGMKAAINGVLNCSTLDGWWAECYQNGIGWAIPTVTTAHDEATRDRLEGQHLYRLVADVIAPLFYEGRRGELPAGWLGYMRRSLVALGPKVEASRMMREYVEDYYEPTALRAKGLQADGWKRARDLAAWKDEVGAAWDGLAVLDTMCAPESPSIDDEVVVTARVELGALSTNDVSVQVLAGPVDVTSEISDPVVVAMEHSGHTGSVHRYRAVIRPSAVGSFGYTVRVVPHHDDLAHLAWAGAVAWA